MRVSWVWVALAAVYFGIAWIVATTLIGAFLLGLNFSLSSALFLTPYLLILALCLLGLRDIANRLNEAFGPRKVREQGGGFLVRVSWQWMALAAAYFALAWSAATTGIGEVLVFLMFSSLIGAIFVPSVLLILALCLIGLRDSSHRDSDWQSPERPS